MSSPLNLEEIYVKLRVRQEETLPSAKEEERVSLAGGEPTELLRLFQGCLAERAVTAISPEEALVQFKRITVLGEPGAGKTTILRHLAVEMADGALQNLPDLPVYVELRSFVESGMKDLLDFVVSDCAKPYKFPDRSYLEKKLNDGEAALLLDGLDEVLGGKSPEEAKKVYNRLAKVVTGVAIEFSNAPIAVTCRRAGWQGLGDGGFRTLEVLDFDESQIQEFVNNWFKSDPSKAKGLLQELEKNLRMKSLAANPLILSLMAIVYGRELKLPERRFELYQHCVEVLLEEWDSEPNRGIQRLNQFTPTHMQNLLIEVAWYFHLQGKGYFREAELLGQLPSFLSNSDINIPLQENKAILEEITGSSSLLKEAAYKLYGFLHLTFQEYFVALAAKKKGSIGWQEVVAHRHEPWWEEVILLLAECMDDATPLLLGILGHPLGQLPPGDGDINQLVPEGKPLSVNDDLFHSDLLLAARCLVGKPQIQMQGLRDRIIYEVKNLFLTSPYELDWNRAARVLAEISDEALNDELLVMLTNNSIERKKQIIIISAFGELDAQNVAKCLLELLKRNVELDRDVHESIVNALCKLKATFAVPSLWMMLKAADQKQKERRDIALAIARLGNKDITPSWENGWVKCNIALAIARLGDKDIAPELLQMLLDKTTASEKKPEIADVLRDLKAKFLATELLERLQDETIDWQIRWLLTESLEGLQESAIEPLREMLKNPNIDQHVRVGIAATLGTWGVRESISYLRNAIESQTVPPNLELSAGMLTAVYSGYVWGRIIRVLKSLSDDLIEPLLVKIFQQYASLQDKSAWDKAGGITATALEYNSDAMARQVLQILRDKAWIECPNDLIRMFPLFITKSLVPELLDLLAKDQIYTALDWLWREIVNAIGQVADDRETVRALGEMWSATSSRNEEKRLLDAIYSALYSVSQRARVRVNRNGQIEQLKN